MTHEDIIKKNGGVSRFAEMLSLPRPRVEAWRLNNSIPAKYWNKIVLLGLSSLQELAEATSKEALPE